MNIYSYTQQGPIVRRAWQNISRQSFQALTIPLNHLESIFFIFWLLDNLSVKTLDIQSEKVHQIRRITGKHFSSGLYLLCTNRSQSYSAKKRVGETTWSTTWIEVTCKHQNYYCGPDCRNVAWIAYPLHTNIFNCRRKT